MRVMAIYTSINYALMCLSVVLIGGLAGGLVYLCLREIHQSRQKQKDQVHLILQRRRQGFSGQSGGLHNNNHLAGDQEGDYESSDDDDDTAWDVDTQPRCGSRLQVPGVMTSQRLSSDDIA